MAANTSAVNIAVVAIWMLRDFGNFCVIRNTWNSIVVMLLLKFRCKMDALSRVKADLLDQKLATPLNFE